MRRYAIYALALLSLVGCTPSYTELRAEKQTILEELGPLTAVVLGVDENTDPYYRAELLAEIGHPTMESAKARYDELRKRLEKVERQLAN